jgi:ABC-type bacteriocin/lantibiotic exporters, contain an N-terminal double-glycine peptidase domain
MATISIGNMLQTLNTIILFWYGARLVMVGELSIGQLVAFNVLVTSVTRPILSVVDLWREFQEVSIGFERLNDVFDATPEDVNDQKRMRLPRISGRIRFENVTFRYPTRPDKTRFRTSISKSGRVKQSLS